MLHVVLDWQKIYKTVLNKAVFFIWWRFYFFGFYVKNVKNGPPERWHFFLEVGHIEYKKLRICADSKNANLSESQNVKIKKRKKWGLAKLENVFFSFFLFRGNKTNLHF
jgi:hypothetical protein